MAVVVAACFIVGTVVALLVANASTAEAGVFVAPDVANVDEPDVANDA